MVQAPNQAAPGGLDQKGVNDGNDIYQSAYRLKTKAYLARRLRRRLRPFFGADADAQETCSDRERHGRGPRPR